MRKMMPDGGRLGAFVPVERLDGLHYPQDPFRVAKMWHIIPTK
jgi:hypothetical protein